MQLQLADTAMSSSAEHETAVERGSGSTVRRSGVVSATAVLLIRPALN